MFDNIAKDLLQDLRDHLRSHRVYVYIDKGLKVASALHIAAIEDETWTSGSAYTTNMHHADGINEIYNRHRSIAKYDTNRIWNQFVF